MKRYTPKINNILFDFSVNTVKHEINENWDEKIKAQWLKNKAIIVSSYTARYGLENFETKFSNKIRIPHYNFFDNRYTLFLHQIIESYVMGYYYPCIVSSCSIIEKILNNLILELRDDYKDIEINYTNDYLTKNHSYEKIHKDKSFSNLSLMIKALEDWNVFTDKTFF